MHCKACDRLLTALESRKRYHDKDSEFVDLCGTCTTWSQATVMDYEDIGYDYIVFDEVTMDDPLIEDLIGKNYESDDNIN